MGTQDQALEEVLQRRRKVVGELERLQGRREQAQASLTIVEEEIRAKGIDPSKIEEKLQQLQDKFQELLDGLQKNVEDAERAIEPFVKGNTP